MKDLIFITGNQHKADYLAKWLGWPVDHRKLDLDELQSLDVKEVIEHKVKQAYDIVKQPVLVEDATLTFTAMGRLPGTFIKFFIEELGIQGLCELVDGLKHREATGVVYFALYDGKTIHYFDGTMHGRIADAPKGDGGFGYDPIFINEGFDITRGEMTEEDYASTSYRAEAIEKLKAHLA